MTKALRLPLLVMLILGLTSAWSKELPQVHATVQEMVVTANPLATIAGVQVLEKGGTATDAMVAVQAMLGLVEPQSSGIGGGAFIVYFDASSGVTTTIDARETAPAAVGGDLFLDERGAPLDFAVAMQSGLSVGVPGVPRMMDYMHQRYGRLPWQTLFTSAIAQAREGFALTQRTSEHISDFLDRPENTSCSERLFLRDPTAFRYFVHSEGERCHAKPAGTRITNTDYADTLELLAKEGADAFYTGAIAKDIVAAVQGDLNKPGVITIDDMQRYQVIERPPLCFVYRGNNVCGMGPPSSGGLAVGQILGVLEHVDLAGRGPLDAEVVHWFTQAMRLAFADRNLYVADSDFVTVPVAGMLDKAYLAQRAALINARDLGAVQPGEPVGVFDPASPDGSTRPGGTSHVSIVDRYGNVLSMTTTIEGAFGNGVMVNGRGFLLNNQLTDFSFLPVADGVAVANRVQPNKRPRSSMAPTIVFDEEGRVSLVTGSPGGARIIGYTAKTIMNVFDFGLDPQQAINVPHYQNLNDATTAIERPIPGVTLDYDALALKAALEARGHSVSMLALVSGLSLIQVTEDGRLLGGADMRRDGAIGGR